jgi:oxygen-independent coproporphyrinogen-3 oxidase
MREKAGIAGAMPMAAAPIEFDPELVRRFDSPGPRYTSYPTADRFVEAFGADAYRSWVAHRNTGGPHRPLALYVHLPFCHDICFYCACNKIVTRDRVKTGRYLEYLAREIEMQGAVFGADRGVVEMHWGGGTPTYHDVEELRALWRKLAGCFDLAADGEYSIEADPRSADASVVGALREMGFNRVSFGVQDLAPEVQAAVNRRQTEEQTMGAIEAARAAAFASVNIDLIYGLPKQTLVSFNRTLARVVAARPDRIALYSYAHLPARFKPQRRISEPDLPSPETKLRLLALGVERLGAAGYVYIGMDHFALPGDALAVAQRQGRLRRSFQGYTAGADCDLVGLGVSAIGAIGPTYSQNFRELESYYDCLNRGELPIMRGVELTADDLLRRAVIQSLICQFQLSKVQIGISYLVDFDRYFAEELAALREYDELGLTVSGKDWITVTPKGRFLVRSICKVFDRYAQHPADGVRHSRMI